MAEKAQRPGSPLLHDQRVPLILDMGHVGHEVSVPSVGTGLHRLLYDLDHQLMTIGIFVCSWGQAIARAAG